MRYYVDTEYVWEPRMRSLPLLGWGTAPEAAMFTLLSIGVVAEDGREFYRQNRHCYPDTRFVAEHVWPVLDNLDWWHHRDDDSFPWTTLHDMRLDLITFIGDDTPEFWGDYAAFDYVALSMLMGDFADWPQTWPMHINDFRQESIPSGSSAIPHHALADARALKEAWDWAFHTANAETAAVSTARDEVK